MLGSYLNLATSVVGGVTSIISSSQQAKQLQRQTQDLIADMESQAIGVTQQITPQIYTPEVTTPERGLFLPSGSNIQRQPTGPSYGWVAPVVLGVAGVGILAYVLTR